MAIATAVEDGTLDAAFESIREALRTERKRSETECAAFEAFADRVDDIGPASERTAWDAGTADRSADAGRAGAGDGRSGAGAVALQPRRTNRSQRSQVTDDITAVREAYEETVMSMPFYAEEYGDTYAESVCDEFGRDVATALTRADCFTPTAERLLRAGIEEATAQRERLVDICERERDSVDDCAAALRAVDEAYRTIESASFDSCGFGELEAYRARLLTLADECERVSTERQETIQHRRGRYRVPADAPDFCVYLYDDFETSYPVLAICSDLARSVEAARTAVESAMARCR